MEEAPTTFWSRLSGAFAAYGPDTVPDLSAAIRAEMAESDTFPEPFTAGADSIGWTDKW